MPDSRPPLTRAAAFSDRFGLRLPILLAPMAGACPASLSIAVANAGGMGAAGVLLLGPEAIARVDARVSGGQQRAGAVEPVGP